MKRTKFIAGALVLSMGLLGTGYAYWTDTLNINTQVSTGKLDMNFVEFKDGNKNVLSTITYAENVEAVLGTADKKVATGAKTVTVNSVDDTMTWNLTNLHPGADTTVHVRIKNEGTIPTKLATAVVGAAGTSGLLFDVKTTDENTETNVTEDNLGKAISKVLAGNYAVGEEKDLYITAKVVTTTNATTNEGEDKAVNLNFKFTWEQYNKAN